MKTLKSYILLLGIITILAAAASAQVLTSVDGAKIDVSRQSDKVVVLAFGASWLPLSVKQADYTTILANKYKGRNVAIYFVVTDSITPGAKNFATDETIRKWAFTNKLTVPVLRVSDTAATLNRFGVDQVPSFVVLDKTGKRFGDTFGGIDPKYDITVPISKTIDKIL
jgi:thiol-disulfide isomerase/thioredoxin